MRQQRSIPTPAKVAPWRWLIGIAACAIAVTLPGRTETAIANGDTRTISLYHAHTHESITATFLVNGQYDQSVLDKLNWFLRDWRRDEPTKMDPRLFDVVWEVYRESGSQQPIMVMSAYRSPETNAMLRRRSRQVAEHSQHILGRAMDQHYMDVPMSRIRELGMKLQRGGVGFYPTAGTPFVHLDVGGVRHWPRMSYDQLARLFPDGKTVHIPSNGQPLPGYELARAELEARGDGSYPTASQLKSKGFFAWLFGGGGSDEDDDDAQAGVRSSHGGGTRMAALQRPGAVDVGGYGKSAADRGGAGFVPAEPFRPAPPPPSHEAQPKPPPAPDPVQPASQPIPQQAIALAVPPATAAAVGAASETSAVDADNTAPIRSLPVATPSALPLPPRRPTDLATTEPAAPLPPLRPADLLAAQTPHDAAKGAATPGRSDPIAALLATSRMARLPDVITQGAGTPHGTALGYAAVAALDGGHAADSVPLPVARPTALLSPRLDRSNFRSLTRPEPTIATTGRSALGAAIPPLRAGAHADLGALAPMASSRTANFEPRATDLSVDHFSGPVAKPTGGVASTAKSTVD